MEALAEALAGTGVATFRYQFPYMEKRAGRPDPPPVLAATVRAAVAAAAGAVRDLSLLAGGKSMGGRMTSQAAAAGPLPGVRGLVFFGFPLHPAGKPAITRAAHLSAVTTPMLFLDGTRDKLAELDLLRPVCESLGERATLHVIDGADHSFHMLKSSGRTDQEVLKEMAETVRGWSDGLAP
jgi:predicted alpha/beta-hydrolase family hydrolase